MKRQQSNILEKAVAYLSGPMEFAKDNGVEWRRKFIKASAEAGLKIDFIDPTDKPGGEDIRINEDKAKQQQLQAEGRWAELKAYVHRYRRYDLRFVDNSDFLVAVIDPTIPQWGTANEIYVAEAQHKPTYFIIEGGLARLPRWLFDVIDLDNYYVGTRCNVYETIEAVIDELKSLDSGLLPLTDEWVLIRKEIEKRRQNPN